MSLSEIGIRYQHIPAHWAATRRCAVKERGEIPALFEALARDLPAGAISGPPFCIIYFVTSLPEGLDVEPGYPVSGRLPEVGVSVRRLPELGVLTLTRDEGGASIDEGYAVLYGNAARQGIISQEFCREVYAARDGAVAGPVEIQFVIHDWLGLLAEHTERALGAERAQALLLGRDELSIESSLEERFVWIRRFVRNLNESAAEEQVYRILSSCAHIFPSEMIAQLTRVYQEERERGGGAWRAVDAVVEFMNRTPGWSEGTVRDGRRIVTRKRPRNPKGFAEASDPARRREAACFCPLIRSRLEDDMPESFCYCGSGWFRRQWEGAIGRPVRVEILQSLLRGDDCCEFAVHLPDDL